MKLQADVVHIGFMPGPALEGRSGLGALGLDAGETEPHNKKAQEETR